LRKLTLFDYNKYMDYLPFILMGLGALIFVFVLIMFFNKRGKAPDKKPKSKSMKLSEWQKNNEGNI